MNMVIFQNIKVYYQIKKQTKLDIWTEYFEKSNPETVERNYDNTRFNKHSSNSKKVC